MESIFDETVKLFQDHMEFGGVSIELDINDITLDDEVKAKEQTIPVITIYESPRSISKRKYRV